MRGNADHAFTHEAVSFLVSRFATHDSGRAHVDDQQQG